MKNPPLLGCIAWIALLVGMAIEMVGRPSGPNTPFERSIVWGVLVVVGVPSLLAYIAGRLDART